MSWVAQEVQPSDDTILDVVLAIDAERHALIEEAETALDPDRIGEIHMRLADIDSREALIYALNDFEGAVVLITHDVYLADGTADQLWLVKDGRATHYDGDLSTLAHPAGRPEHRPRLIHGMDVMKPPHT